ncbi:hypothetical protein LEN26_005648 [Aphanomyces euteiches]|nr:hypothetical protein AeMF1_009853 [Aphanomyces euteiches]KAH9137626.1 hypothetical protein LEN26_005648 [Aphanomyces euteiches]KAH9189025.1 hypothetical protein AeNC1_008997 [Aphanomyces euteiches]
MKSALLTIVALLATSCSTVQGQVPIPVTPPGFTYGDGSADAPIQLEVFVDLLCPDSKAAHPGLKDLAARLSPEKFRLRIHQFPLPYHQQAYSFAQASQTITHALGADKFTKWLEAVYDVQDQYWNLQTENLGQKQVTEKIEQLAKATFPQLTDAQWKEGMSGHGGTKRDSDTRSEWKHACTRGISGTPQYLLNDVAIEADSKWTADDWLKFLKPLLHGESDVLALSAKNPVNPIVHQESVSGSGLSVYAFVAIGTVVGVVATLFVVRRGRREYDSLA